MQRRTDTRNQMERESYRRNRISRRQRKRQIMIRTLLTGVGILGIVAVVFWGGNYVLRSRSTGMFREGAYDIGRPTKQVPQPELDVQLLTVNEYSRPGIATDPITGVVIHYTANPGSTAQNNRDYFENLKDTKETKVSSNFIVGLDGEIIQCVPTAEMAYASNSRNSDTVSIECCHPDETGKFNKATYESLVELTAFLCGKFNLEMEDIIRHYDVTGKNCPKYFVENEEAWTEFKNDVANYIEKNGK